MSEQIAQEYKDMEPVLLGYIIGRVLLSYLLVWVVCYLFSKFNYKNAAKMLHTKYGLLGVAVVCVAPLISSLGRGV